MSVNIVPPTGAIIHFEATGSVCRKPQSFKKNNTYSIDLRCHQSTIPIAELITSQQNICSISLFFKMTLEVCLSYAINAKTAFFHYNFHEIITFSRYSPLWGYFESVPVCLALGISYNQDYGFFYFH
ncbi:unnamed protein product [Acanthoscelides obtectus]|uniref:Uncharacterized protein n=1 Tax=Acanthoscelides obtectus TaxID=200917 RepID=A0A9P0Q5A2_ACAOB|nr:unnamed protein product [Acanthoscelides obtectus]CAK1665504.1 hypothetical protein AOBTE_LOCUS24853 [Acanthoscelides obtectus]